MKRVRKIFCDACASLENPPKFKECRACFSLYQKKYYRAHYEANKDYYKTKRARWRKDNPVAESKYMKAYREKHHERILKMTYAARQKRIKEHRKIQAAGQRRRRYGHLAEAATLLYELEELINSSPEFLIVPEVRNKKQKRRYYHEKVKPIKRGRSKRRDLGHPQKSEGW